MRQFISIIENENQLTDASDLEEEFFGGFDTLSGTVEIFKNPSRQEFNMLYRQHRSIRGLFGEDEDGNGVLYIWDAHLATHQTIYSKYNIGGVHLEWEDRPSGAIMIIQWNNSWNNPDEPNLENFEAVKQWIISNPIMPRLLKGFKVVRA